MPWIPVLYSGGQSRDVSLSELLRDANIISRIGGNPLEAAVLHRLVFAIAHRAIGKVDLKAWVELWKQRPTFITAMSDYLESNAELFDLYSETAPFAQHPGLPNPASTTALIVYDRAQGNNPIFFDGSVVKESKPLPSAVAARALLVTHAFGGSGTGGLNPLNGGKKDTMYAGPLCARMIAVLEGKSLADTILLNFAVGLSAGDPAWERKIESVPKQTRPNGLSDLYTRPTRNAKLCPDETGQLCVGVSVCMGEAVIGSEDVSDDPLVPVYFAKTDKKFKALRVSVDKALWRNMDVLLAPKSAAETRPLPSISRVAELLTYEELFDRGALRLRTMGVAANAQGPVSELWRDESLPFSLGMFSAKNGYQELVNALTKAESEANRLQTQLKDFAKQYLADGGGSPDPKDVARLVDELSSGSSDYWLDIGPQGELLALESQDEAAWSDRCEKARRSALQTAIEKLTPDARRYRSQFARSDQQAESQKRVKEKN